MREARAGSPSGPRIRAAFVPADNPMRGWAHEKEHRIPDGVTPDR